MTENRGDERSAERSDERPGERPAERSDERPGERPAERPAEGSAGRHVAEAGLGMTRERPDGGEPATASRGGVGFLRGRRLAVPPTARRFLAVASREYRVVHRGGWTLGLSAVFAAFAAGVVVFGATGVGPTRPAAVVATLAELAVYLVPLAALALGYGTIVGADERGALEPVLALPVSRRAVLVGLYAGRAAALAGAMLIGFGVGGTVFVRTAGWAAWGAYAVFVAAAIGAGLAFLAVGVLLSALAEEKTRALGAALAAWAWFVLAHDLVALGVVVALDPPSAVVSALVLASPADLLRVLVLSTVGTGTGPGGLVAILEATPLSVPAAVAALAAWTVGPVAAAALAFGRR